MSDELMKYAMVAIAIATLAFAAFSYTAPAAQPAANLANVLALQQKQVVQGVSSTGASSTSAAQTQALDSNECGDLNDDANVQHLGHHPDRYAECLKQVDGAVLKRATGKTLGQLIG